MRKYYLLLGLFVFICSQAVAETSKPSLWFESIEKLKGTERGKFDVIFSEGGFYREGKNRDMPKSFTKEEAFYLLLNTKTFGGPISDYNGGPSDEIRAFRVVLKSNDVQNAFKHLLSNGRTAGKILALCGLYLTDKKEFDAQHEKLLSSKKHLAIELNGCGASTSRKISAIIKNNNPRTIRRKPSQPLKDLRIIYFHSQDDEPYELDIYGGGLPALLINVNLPEK